MSDFWAALSYRNRYLVGATLLVLMDLFLVQALASARPAASPVRHLEAAGPPGDPALMASCEPKDYSGRLDTQVSLFVPGQPITATARVTSRDRSWCRLTTGCGYFEMFITDLGGGMVRRAAYSPRCHRYDAVTLGPGTQVSIAMNPLAGIAVPGLYRIWSGYAPPATVLVL